jgi:F0F1-type ATP synthase assembly protein I
MADGGKGMQESEKKSWLKAEAVFQVGATLVLAPLVGYFIGAWLDGRMHTTWIKIAGLLVGIAGGFVQLIRVAGSEGNK